MDIQERIAQLEEELSRCKSGYISRKMINGKERFYLQWTENGKLKSKYLKKDELQAATEETEKRKKLKEELKKLKSTPEGARCENAKRAAARNMKSITGKLMSGDFVAADIKNGIIVNSCDKYLPLYLKRVNDFEGWLALRAIDSHRTNSRLLKKALRIGAADDAATALAVNAATVTDRYWFKPEGSSAKYDDIKFKENYFAELALRGDPDGFSRRPSRTPELTNIGSFEKCWKLLDGEWWMYKSGNEKEIFSEFFICRLGERLGLNTAHYEIDGKYIRSKDFTDGANVNFESMRSLAGENEDYKYCFDILLGISKDVAKQYLLLLWMDTVCYNMDRHTENFGVLRDVNSGEILSLAPNYDNNIALISNGYHSDVLRKHDGLIRFFKEFLSSSYEARKMYRQMKLPKITEKMIYEIFDEIPIKVDEEFVAQFVLNGQKRVREIIDCEECGEAPRGLML